jgi:hypothetical protein
LDPHHPKERDHSGNENNVLTIDDLLKLPAVGSDSSASAIENEKQEESPVQEEVDSVLPKDDQQSPATTEAAEEAAATTSVTDTVKDKIMEVTAAGGAVAAAAGAAVVGFMSGGIDGVPSDRETSPIPGTFPDTPVVEKTEDNVVPVVEKTEDNVVPVVEQVAKTDDEPVPGVVIPAKDESIPTPTDLEPETAKDESIPTPNNLEPETTDSTTVALETGVAATATGGFAAALAADKAANTAPTHTYIPSAHAIPENNDSFGILPVPSATAPQGTKPLAESTYADPAPASTGSLVPEPVATKEVSPLPQTENFEPVNNDSNIISTTEETSSSTTDHIETLKAAALKSSEHAAQTAAKALAIDAPTPPALDAKATLAGLSSGAGVTAIGTATDQDTDETGLSRFVAKKEDEKVQVDATSKAAHIEPTIVFDNTQLIQPHTEVLGSGGHAAVASTPVVVSIPTNKGVQEITALGTAIVTDGSQEAQALKTELMNNGKTTLPEGALAHLAPENEEVETPKKETIAPATPAKDVPATPSKTPVTQSSAIKKDRPVSGAPSEATQSSEKKKKGGFFRKLKKAFS